MNKRFMHHYTTVVETFFNSWRGFAAIFYFMVAFDFGHAFAAELTTTWWANLLVFLPTTMALIYVPFAIACLVRYMRGK